MIIALDLFFILFFYLDQELGQGPCHAQNHQHRLPQFHLVPHVAGYLRHQAASVTPSCLTFLLML